MEDKVLECLANATKPMRPGEIAEALNADKKEVEKAIKKLKDTGAIHSPVRCCYAKV